MRLIQLVNFAFFCVYAMLFARFVVEYVRANEQIRFVQYVHRYTEPLYRPFRGLLPVLPDPGGHPLVLSILAAMLAFFVVHVVVRGLLRASSRPALREE
ncbi:YggT family protein [Pendulispora rubella]|uniref:YggT family protein n=1 Tax=Pendulispora rubella TaxID=2741070 RepID=UPI0030E14784